MMLLSMDSPIQYVALFAVFSVTGVLGEAMFCAAWRMVHGRPFWTYTVAPILRGCSSWLNFIPWGIGGYVYLVTYELILRATGVEHPFPLELVAIVLGVMFLFSCGFALVQKKKKIRSIRTVTVMSVLPLAVVAAVDPVVGVFLVVGGVVTGILEYFYGKTMRWVFGKKFWEYHVLSRDDGHLSLLALPGFAVAGLFFLLVAHTISLFF